MGRERGERRVVYEKGKMSYKCNVQLFSLLEELFNKNLNFDCCELSFIDRPPVFLQCSRISVLTEDMVL